MTSTSRDRRNDALRKAGYVFVSGYAPRNLANNLTAIFAIYRPSVEAIIAEADAAPPKSKGRPRKS